MEVNKQKRLSIMTPIQKIRIDISHSSLALTVRVDPSKKLSNVIKLFQIPSKVAILPLTVMAMKSPMDVLIVDTSAQLMATNEIPSTADTLVPESGSLGTITIANFQVPVTLEKAGVLELDLVSRVLQLKWFIDGIVDIIVKCEVEWEDSYERDNELITQKNIQNLVSGFDGDVLLGIPKFEKSASISIDNYWAQIKETNCMLVDFEPLPFERKIKTALSKKYKFRPKDFIYTKSTGIVTVRNDTDSTDFAPLNIKLYESDIQDIIPRCLSHQSHTECYRKTLGDNNDWILVSTDITLDLEFMLDDLSMLNKGRMWVGIHEIPYNGETRVFCENNPVKTVMDKSGKGIWATILNLDNSYQQADRLKMQVSFRFLVPEKYDIIKIPGIMFDDYSRPIKNISIKDTMPFNLGTSIQETGESRMTSLSTTDQWFVRSMIVPRTILTHEHPVWIVGLNNFKRNTHMYNTAYTISDNQKSGTLEWVVDLEIKFNVRSNDEIWAIAAVDWGQWGAPSSTEIRCIYYSENGDGPFSEKCEVGFIEFEQNNQYFKLMTTEYPMKGVVSVKLVWDSFKVDKRRGQLPRITPINNLVLEETILEEESPQKSDFDMYDDLNVSISETNNMRSPPPSFNCTRCIAWEHENIRYYELGSERIPGNPVDVDDKVSKKNTQPRHSRLENIFGTLVALFMIILYAYFNPNLAKSQMLSISEPQPATVTVTEVFHDIKTVHQTLESIITEVAQVTVTETSHATITELATVIMPTNLIEYITVTSDCSGVQNMADKWRVSFERMKKIVDIERSEKN